METNVLRIAPERLRDLSWMAPADPSHPTAIVFDGEPAEWLRAADQRGVAADLADCTVPTVALVRGAPPDAAARLLGAFDLVAAGPAGAVEERLSAWIQAIQSRPQASAITARLVRLESGSLVVESMAYSVLQSGREFASWLASRPPRVSAPGGHRVALTMADDYAELVLARPSRHNAFDSLMREQLCDALDTFAAGEIPALGVRGSGPSFCSGGDLDEFGTFRDPASAHLIRSGRSVAARFLALRHRMAVAIHGATIGAGIELAAFAARVVAGDDVRISLPEVGFGLLPGSGGTVSIPARIGRQTFLDLALTGRTVGAVEALELGLVDEVAPTSELPARLRALAESLR